MNPRYPIYIVSKGRWESRKTMKALQVMGVPFRVIVEEQEREKYAGVLDPKVLLTLDPEYQRNYNPCCDLEPSQSKGSGPARNFAWDHSIGLGAKRHWVLDDNIIGFYRFNHNLKVSVSDGTIFRCMEDFTERYINVDISGPNYFMFAPRRQMSQPPIYLNTRIYSCILLRNDIPQRWEGRYNEDTHLSLRILKSGRCSVLFNAFLQDKMVTLHMKGGNTDELYAKGTTEKSEMLRRLHPDIATVVRRYGRVHHHVDYRKFRKNRLILREGVRVREGTDNYGMEFKTGFEHEPWTKGRAKKKGPEGPSRSPASASG